MQDHVKSPAQIQIDEVISPSFAHQCCHSTVEGHWVGQALFALHEAVSTVFNNIIFLCTLTYLPGGSAPQSFQASDEAHWLMVPRFFFLLFKEMEVLFPFLQTLDTLPDSHDFSDMMESGLGTSSEMMKCLTSMRAHKPNTSCS